MRLIYQRLEQGLIPEGGMGLKNMRDLGAYAIVLIIRGGGTFESRYGVEVLQSGSLILLFPGILHRYCSPPDDPWMEYFIVFKGTLFDAWQERGLISPDRPVIQLDPVEHWSARMQSIIGSPPIDPTDDLLEALRLQSFLADAIAASGQGKDDGSRWFALAKEAIQQRLPDPNGVRLAAADLGMGYENFRKKFSQHGGQAPGQFRMEQLMMEAQRRLANSEDNIKEISESLGFCDAYHFSKSFKAESGVSPSQYRKERRDRAAAFWKKQNG